MLHISVKECGQKQVPGKGAEVKLRCELGCANEGVSTRFNGKYFYALFLCESSQGELIDFRRFSPSRLKPTEEILLSTVVRKPNTKLRCHIMCDDIAGSRRPVCD